MKASESLRQGIENSGVFIRGGRDHIGLAVALRCVDGLFQPLMVTVPSESGTAQPFLEAV